MKLDIWKDTREKAIKHESGLLYIKGQTVGGKPDLMVWMPKAQKPYIRFCYPSTEARDNHLAQAIINYESYKIMMEKRKEASKPKPELVATLKKGDLFYTSWGYDQTNYDYLAVLSVSPTGKTVKCQMTSRLHMGESGQSNVQEPIFCPYGDIFTLKIGNGGDGHASLRGSYPYCDDGSMQHTRFGYFSPAKVGQQFHETMSEFGH